MFKAAQVEPGEGPSGRGCGVGITTSPVLEGALMPVLQNHKTASRCRVCNRDAERIPPRDFLFLCCVMNGRIKHPTLVSAAQVIHISSSPVFWERKPLCRSSVLLGMQWEGQPVNRDASPHLCKLIKAVKIYLVSPCPDKKKEKKSHFNWGNLGREKHTSVDENFLLQPVLSTFGFPLSLLLLCLSPAPLLLTTSHLFPDCPRVGVLGVKKKSCLALCSRQTHLVKNLSAKP